MSPKPNIIFLSDDEHRWNFCTGGLIDSLKTPAIDRLKQRGVTLTNAVTNAPICMPARFYLAYRSLCKSVCCRSA